jgi:hypothetical protein
MRARRVSRRKKRIKTAAFRASTGGLGVGTPRSGFCPHQQNPQPTSIRRLPLRLVQIVTLTGGTLNSHP